MKPPLLMDLEQKQWQGLGHIQMYGLFGYPEPRERAVPDYDVAVRASYRFKVKQRARKAYKTIRRAILEAGDL